MDEALADEIALEDFLKWESRQNQRYEWIDGAIVRCAGGSDDHAAVMSNVPAIIRNTVAGGPYFVRGSDRNLVPQDAAGRNLGSFYSDLFVSCAAIDRKGNAAQFPSVTIEVLSEHVGKEFTKKKLAYLASRDLKEYLIVDSTQQYAILYRRCSTVAGRSPNSFAAPCRETIGLTLDFERIYAEINVPAITRPASPGTE